MNTVPIFNNNIFTNIMREYENDDTIKVETYKESKACDPGGSFTCDVTRMELEGTKKTDGMSTVYKTSIIVKKVPNNKLQAGLYRSILALENEMNAYKHIIPALARHTFSGVLPVADCLEACEDFILLQDLSLKGYKTIDRSEGGLNLEQCTSVVLTLAKLHAASFVMEKKDPDTLDELSRILHEIIFTGRKELLKSQKRYVELALNTFQNLPNRTRVEQRAVIFLSDLYSSYDEIIKSLMRSRPLSVFCHGDAWVGNIMFDKDGDVKLIDLQLMRLTSVASDLCFLFYVNLKPDLTVKYFKPLLEKYLEALRQNTKMLDVDMDDVLTNDWLSQEMSDFALYGLMRALWITPLFFYKAEDVDLGNITESVLYDVDQMLSKVGDRYIPHMKALVLNYVKLLR